MKTVGILITWIIALSGWVLYLIVQNKKLKKNNAQLCDYLNETESRCRDTIKSKDRIFNQYKLLRIQIAQLKDTVNQLKCKENKK